MTAVVFMLNMRSGLNGALFVQRSGAKKREWKTEIIAQIILQMLQIGFHIFISAAAEADHHNIIFFESFFIQNG